MPQWCVAEVCVHGCAECLYKFEQLASGSQQTFWAVLLAWSGASWGEIKLQLEVYAQGCGVHSVSVALLNVTAFCRFLASLFHWASRFCAPSPSPFVCHRLLRSCAAQRKYIPLSLSLYLPYAQALELCTLRVHF